MIPTYNWPALVASLEALSNEAPEFNGAGAVLHAGQVSNA